MARLPVAAVPSPKSPRVGELVYALWRHEESAEPHATPQGRRLVLAGVHGHLRRVQHRDPDRVLAVQRAGPPCAGDAHVDEVGRVSVVVVDVPHRCSDADVGLRGGSREVGEDGLRAVTEVPDHVVGRRLVRGVVGCPEGGLEARHLVHVHRPVRPGVNLEVGLLDPQVDSHQGEGRRLFQQLDPAQQHLQLPLHLGERQADLQGVPGVGGLLQQVQQGCLRRPEVSHPRLCVEVLGGDVCARGGLRLDLYSQVAESPDGVVEPLGRNAHGNAAAEVIVPLGRYSPAAHALRQRRHPVNGRLDGPGHD